MNTQPSTKLKLLSGLAKCNKKLREQSKCPVCDKPRESMLRNVGSNEVTTVDDSGTLSDMSIGGMPESCEAAGMCLCERVVFYDTLDTRVGSELRQHIAHQGIIVGYTLASSETDVCGVTELKLIIARSKSPIKITANDFNCNVLVKIIAPGQEHDGLKFALARTVADAA